MKTYYFDLFDGVGTLIDEYGDGFQDVQEAADQAAALLSDMALDRLSNRRDQEFGVAVRDARQDDVYHAALIFRETYPDPERPGPPQDVAPVLSAPNPIDAIRRSRETLAASRQLVSRFGGTVESFSDTLQQTLEALAATKALMARTA